MSVVLSVCGENAYKEFVLPAASNIRTTLVIRRDVFGLEENLELFAENEDGTWYLSDDNDPRLEDPRQRPRRVLANGDYYLYRVSGRTVLFVMVSVSDQRFSSYRRYRLPSEGVQIGTGPECALQYSFVTGNAEYISRCHARITLTDGGMVLTDTSHNGVFVNSARVREPVRLKFGDRIDIWGLNLVALDSVLAVRANPALRIDQSRLVPGDLPARPLQQPEQAGARVSGIGCPLRAK